MLNVVIMSSVSNLNLASGLKIDILDLIAIFNVHFTHKPHVDLPMRVADIRDHLPLAPI